ncbi:MAG TPA: N-acetyl sugar amidotransferase [Syntrophales bacterium]|nr:N-acetyl sugar amidotransferase [Syntrophales bacterium]
MHDKVYRMCSNCIMDTTDPDITFDERGWCDYCRNFHDNILPNWHPDEAGERELLSLAGRIKNDGRGRDHDCLIGISGGVDSSYAALIAKEKLGLKPLLYHVDAGWNSETSANNIQRLVEALGLDLYTDVIDWQEMQDLQLSFFKAQVANVDTPQDLAFFSSLYNFAVQNKFRYILTGGNYSTECVREPHAWGAYYPTDMRFVRDIHRRFGRIPLKTFPTADILKYKLYYGYIKGLKIIKPLNYVPYIKEQAMQELAQRFGWQKYAQKHHESRFTRFVECYWLPRKFGVERRKAHLSSLILTGQMSRDEALARIASPEIDEQTMIQDFEYVAKKLGLTAEEFRQIFAGENRSYKDYKNKMSLITLGTKATRWLGIEKRVIR